MSNWAIGIDFVDIPRFRNHPPINNKRFYERVFSIEEKSYCSQYADPFPHYAGIFSAKEAVFKAINSFLPEITLFQIQIIHNEHKKPFVVLLSANSDSQRRENDDIINNGISVQVSITHTNKLACAWALAQRSSFDTKEEPIILDSWSEISQKMQQVIDNEFND
ncbi:MAG: holo-ACP synthase [Candidatus Hodarchaeales archaeon]|jgi:holo-[acyl-carrier protein] synthase